MLNIVKRIQRYLKGNQSHGILYQTPRQELIKKPMGNRQAMFVLPEWERYYGHPRYTDVTFHY